MKASQLNRRRETQKFIHNRRRFEDWLLDDATEADIDNLRCRLRSIAADLRQGNDYGGEVRDA